MFWESAIIFSENLKYGHVPPLPSAKVFGNFLANYLHFSFQTWILRKSFFFVLLTDGRRCPLFALLSQTAHSN